MELNRLIIHELKKEARSTDTEIHLSQELLPIDNNSSKLIERLLKSYQGDKILYAEFDDSPGKYFPEQFGTYRDTEMLDEDFILFTQNTTGNLETIIKSKVLARGGYIVFAEYNIGETDFVVIFLIRDTEGQILRRSANGYRIQPVEYLDTNHLAMACRINENKIDSEEINYISFTRLRQQDVADYFTDWISIKQLESSTEYTNKLYEIINSLPLPTNPANNQTYSIDEVRNMVYENAKNNGNHNIDLRTISRQIYGNENIINDYIEEHNISIDSEFRYDKRVMRKFIQIYVRKDGITLKYSRGDSRKVRISEEDPNLILIESESFANALRQQLDNE